ncbi:DUF5690 family protein [soil metagenome]
MEIIDRLRIKVAKWPYGLLSVMAAVSAFGTYTCMYSFRKAFTAGMFTGHQYFHVDYKVWLVIAQVLGYCASKFYGIKFISEVKGNKRGITILMLIGISWLALLAFAFVPAPYNIIFLFVNGFPLGLIWGLVFGYIEGRRTTEFMSAVLCCSFIFGSGFVKTVGRTLLQVLPINDFQMPFLTGAVFALPLLLFIFLLELMPAPTAEDIRLRTERAPMNADDRKKFLLRFLPGIILTLVVYVLLTIMRDVRDNFGVEIWRSLGVKGNAVFASTDAQISLMVLAVMSLLIVVKKNLLAFSIIHMLVIGGCVLIGLSTALFSMQIIGPTAWMTLTGLGVYLGYVPYNGFFFDRLIAAFQYKSNVGFIIYVSDSLGYLGSVVLMMVKEFGRPHISWGDFFKEGVVFVAIIGGVCATLSWIYFYKNAKTHAKEQAEAGGDHTLSGLPA